MINSKFNADSSYCSLLLKFYIEFWHTFTRSKPVVQCWLLPATSALSLENKLCGLSVKLNLLSPVFIQMRVVCFESNDSLFPSKTQSVCFSEMLSFSDWLQRHLLRVFNSLDGNCHYLGAPLKHAIELDGISAMSILLHVLIRQGFSWWNTTFSLHFVRKSTLFLPVDQVIGDSKPECLSAKSFA